MIRDNIYKTIRYLFLTMAVASTLHMVMGCGGDGNSSSEPSDGTDSEPLVTTVSEVIDETGGTLEVSDTDSPADGAKVLIQPGALTEEREISISHGETDIELPQALTSAGGQIDFGPDGLQFEAPVYISVPYSDDDNDGILDGTEIYEYRANLFYYNESTGFWEGVDIVNRNTGNNVIEAETSHFSTYLVAIDDDDDSDPSSSATVFWQGEYFVGTPEFRILDPDQDINADGNKELILKGCIGQDWSECGSDNSCAACGTPYVLTITADGTLKAVIDRHATYTGGHKVAIDDTGTSVTVDISELFEKIKLSEDAGLWDWRCEFISEYTRLSRFDVCDDDSSDAICSETNEKFYSSIDVISRTQIRINLGIDISDTTDSSGAVKPNGNFGGGDMLAIKFEANYK